MSIVKKLESKIKNVFKENGYEIDSVNLVKSSRVDLGNYQINDCMSLAKKYGKNPREIAEQIAKILENDEDFCNVNVAGPGFINITFTDKFYINLVNDMNNDLYNNIDKESNKKVFIDYGGANAAKALHVGHMRSPNIGEALRRLAITLGNEVIGDVHLGDMGRQSGMVISELMREQPNLPWFDQNYQGEYPNVNLTNDDLGRLYPAGNIAAKESDERMEEVREITAKIDKGDPILCDLWRKIIKISSDSIKETYDKLNCKFDLWEGEMDACNYKEQVLNIFKDFLYESNGALVIDVKEDGDKVEIPPLIVIKSDGATIYATRDLGSLYSRIERFNPSEVWYFTDNRQSLYFKQVFRASYKTGMVPETTKLMHFDFGTVNGLDGKPFKTRDGGVMQLETLISLIKEEITKHIREDITGEDRERIADQLSIATLKYADLLPNRSTDYIFDISKFASFEGKTGPYLLYSTIRMKSLLTKAKESGINYNQMCKLNNNGDSSVALELLNLPICLTNAYNSKSLNEICEYLYKLTNTYNKFYQDNRILLEDDKELRESWLTLTSVVYNVNMLLLDILAIEVPEKM